MPRQDQEGNVRFWLELASCHGDIDGTLDLLVRRTTEVVGEGAMLILLSDSGEFMEPKYVHHPDPELKSLMEDYWRAVPARADGRMFGDLVAGNSPMVTKRGVPGFSADALNVARRSREMTLDPSFIVVPVRVSGEVIGIFGAFRVSPDTPYAESDQAILEAFAARASMAITNDRDLEPLDAQEYRAIFDHSLEGILFAVPGERIFAANPAACAILRRTESEICTLGGEALFVYDDPRTKRMIHEQLSAGVGKGEVPMMTGDDRTIIVEMSSATFTTTDQGLCTFTFFRDVTDKVEMREQLEHLVKHDSLTGLLNRRGFFESAQRALDVADRQAIDIQLLYCDLDNLKVVNDTAGHHMGDRLIQQLGEAIMASIRAVDIAARLSGDEFAVLLLGCSREDSKKTIERIQTKYSETAGDSFQPSVSVGMAKRRAGSTKGLDEVLKEADRKMYFQKSKRRGAPVGVT